MEAISHTIGRVTTVNHTDYSEESNESDEENIVTDNQNSCVVCLTIRTTTWIFLPCRHANCCAECAKRIEEKEIPVQSVVLRSKQVFKYLLISR